MCHYLSSGWCLFFMFKMKTMHILYSVYGMYIIEILDIHIYCKNQNSELTHFLIILRMLIFTSEGSWNSFLWNIHRIVNEYSTKFNSDCFQALYHTVLILRESCSFSHGQNHIGKGLLKRGSSYILWYILRGFPAINSDLLVNPSPSIPYLITQCKWQVR